VATFTTLFSSSNAAESFEDWVMSRDGRNLVEPLLWYDPMICGAKVKRAPAPHMQRFCTNADGSLTRAPLESSSSPSSMEQSTSDAPYSPVFPSSDDSPRELSSESLDYPPPAAPPSTPVPDSFWDGLTFRRAATARGGSTTAATVAATPSGVAALSANVPSHLSNSDKQRSEAVAVCRPVFTVRWALKILPGYINQESGVDVRSGYWSPAADEHFYTVTNVLVRRLAGQRMNAGSSADSDGIKLSSGVTHSVGRIGSSDCARGVMKQVQYEFSFSDLQDAIIFRDWLKPEESKEIAQSLRALDPSGVCAVAGTTGTVREGRRCEVPESALHKFNN
jgi:hypothetical protein